MINIANVLTENYHLFPLDLESQLPSISLKELIDRCNDNTSDRDTAQEIMYHFINGVTQLDCFTYRAVNQVNGEPVYWNALKQTYDDFKQTDTVIYQADAPYPTTDMILAWCHKQRA